MKNCMYIIVFFSLWSQRAYTSLPTTLPTSPRSIVALLMVYASIFIPALALFSYLSVKKRQIKPDTCS